VKPLPGGGYRRRGAGGEGGGEALASPLGFRAAQPRYPPIAAVIFSIAAVSSGWMPPFASAAVFATSSTKAR
jgi:hypothetical protein